MVFQSELASILANDLDILPAQSVKTLPSDFAQGRGEIDEIDTGEEVRDIDEFSHSLDVEASATANLQNGYNISFIFTSGG